MITSENSMRDYLEQQFAKANSLPSNNFRDRTLILSETYCVLVEVFDHPSTTRDLKRYCTQCVLVVSEMTNILHEAIALAMMSNFSKEETASMIKHATEVTKQMAKQIGVDNG